MDKPGLLLDVDGPLNPYRMSNKQARRAGYTKARLASGWAECHVELNPRHGPMLFGFAEHYDLELIWATMWEEYANVYVGPAIGLPQLPVIQFGKPHEWAAWWKFRYVHEYMRDRPLAWFDDEFQLEHELGDWFLNVRGDAPTLLVDVSPETGLTLDHFEQVKNWRNAL